MTLRDLMTCFPFNETITRYTITGNQLTRIFSHIMRKENRGGEGECYQVNSSVKATYSEDEAKLTSLKIDNQDVIGDEKYTIALQAYHSLNAQKYLNIPQEELHALKTKVVAASSFNILEEFLKSNQNISRRVEGRLQYLKA